LFKKDLHIRNYLLTLYSLQELEALAKSVNNPLGNPFVIRDLEILIQRAGTLDITPAEKNRMLTILEDDLVAVKLICQDSKCDPFRLRSEQMHK
jgi:hypothetical protein